MDVTVYQYKICPFCNKVKSFLDYLELPYDVVEVNPISKKEIKGLDTGGHTKVPVVTVDGIASIESNDIIFALVDRLKQDKAFSAHALHGKLKTLMTEDTQKWAEWSEKELAVMLYPNITRNFRESWEAFEYCGDVESWSALDRASNRYFGPVAMYFANGKVKKKYNIVHERAELKVVCETWTSAVAKTTDGPFLHGARVTMPDLMVFGVLKAIAGLPTFNEIMAENKDLLVWYIKVSDAIGGH